MPIYFSRPKNAGEAFRRIAQSIGGKNIPELKTNEVEVIDGVKQATRCYDNGVKIVSRGEAIVVADENKVIMAKHILKTGVKL